MDRVSSPPAQARAAASCAAGGTPLLEERLHSDASIEIEAAEEARDFLSGFVAAGSGQAESRNRLPVSLVTASQKAIDTVDAEMQRVEEMLDRKTNRAGHRNVRVRARMRPGPAVVREARAQSHPGGEETAYEDAFAALTLNDEEDNAIDEEDDDAGVKVKVLARHCITSWYQCPRQQSEPRKWGCHIVHCSVPRSVGKKASSILRFCTGEIGSLVAIDEFGGRLHISDEDHALYQKGDERPLQGDDECVSHVLHHCSVTREIEDGSADKQGCVDLSHRNLKEMPSALLAEVKHGAVAVLNLSHNLLSTIPSRFFLDRHRSQLSRLHSLLLSDNMLRLLPPGLDELVNLQVLSLGNNRLTELPWQIGKLRNLRSLFLDRNCLSELPWECRSLTSLQDLQLGSNNFARFPSRILGVRSLKRLGLARNNISSLPATIGGHGDLRKLESLDLTANRIRHLPDGIGSLPKLSRLFLASNCIRCIPQAWEPLRNSLKIIHLGGNADLAHPGWIKELPSASSGK
eukprot:g641.t1